MPDKESATTDRRVRRTRRALQDAFVALVLEHGYDKVSIEDITVRADVARATFYAHYARKEELLTAVFTELLNDLATSLTYEEGPWTVVRTGLVAELYRHADEFRDLYRVCLSGAGDGRARDAYLEVVVQATLRNYEDRINALGLTPRVPVVLMARAVAGAHLALLQSWLGGGFDYSIDEMAALQLDLMVGGVAWGHGLALDELTFASEPKR